MSYQSDLKKLRDFLDEEIKPNTFLINKLINKDGKNYLLSNWLNDGSFIEPPAFDGFQASITVAWLIDGKLYAGYIPPDTDSDLSRLRSITGQDRQLIVDRPKTPELDDEEEPIIV